MILAIFIVSTFYMDIILQFIISGSSYMLNSCKKT